MSNSAKNLKHFQDDGVFVKKIRYINIEKTEKIILKENKVISLFTGAGGFDIGLEQAGYETAVCVEIDPDCRETLRANRPDWTLFEDGNGRIPGDIRAIEAEELLAFAKITKGEAALVVGGAPCQPFSNMGKKEGKNDVKNGDLFLEFVKIVRAAMPKAFIFENVVGITQKKHNSVLNYIVQNLRRLGYNTAWSVLNAADYGTAQIRKRFIIIGIQVPKEPVFPKPTNYGIGKDTLTLNWIYDLSEEAHPRPWITLGEVLKKIPRHSEKREDFLLMNNSEKVIKRMEYIKQGQIFKVLPDELKPDCWKTGKHQGHDTFGRLSLDKPCVTIRTAAYNPSKGKYIHPTENRGLSTVEMAAIQGFPTEWTFKCFRKKPTLTSVSRQIGNAVPPPLARALGLALKPIIKADI